MHRQLRHRRRRVKIRPQDDPQLLNPAQINNLKAFLKIDFIPNDIRFTLLKDLTSGGQAGLKGL